MKYKEINRTFGRFLAPSGSLRRPESVRAQAHLRPAPRESPIFGNPVYCSFPTVAFTLSTTDAGSGA